LLADQESQSTLFASLGIVVATGWCIVAPGDHQECGSLLESGIESSADLRNQMPPL